MPEAQQTIEALIHHLQAQHPGRSRSAILADLDQAGAKIRELAAQGYTLEELIAFIEEAGDECT